MTSTTAVPAFTDHAHRTGITDKRPGERRRWKPIKTVERVRWVRPPLHVYRDKLYGSHLWWMRCDVCRDEYKLGFGLARSHAGALAMALRHARVAHKVVI